jgi:hypothetical protein
LNSTLELASNLNGVSSVVSASLKRGSLHIYGACDELVGPTFSAAAHAGFPLPQSEIETIVSQAENANVAAPAAVATVAPRLSTLAPMLPGTAAKEVCGKVLSCDTIPQSSSRRHRRMCLGLKPRVVVGGGNGGLPLFDPLSASVAVHSGGHFISTEHNVKKVFRSFLTNASTNANTNTSSSSSSSSSPANNNQAPKVKHKTQKQQQPKQQKANKQQKEGGGGEGAGGGPNVACSRGKVLMLHGFTQVASWFV